MLEKINVPQLSHCKRYLIDQCTIWHSNFSIVSKKILVKFIYSEKATNFCAVSILNLSYVSSNRQIYGGDCARFCGLLRMYELKSCFPSLIFYFLEIGNQKYSIDFALKNSFEYQNFETFEAKFMIIR